MRYTLIIFVLIINAIHLYAQDSEFIFGQSTNTLKPFLSDIRSPLIKAESGFLNKLDGNYFVKDFNNKPFIETNLGVTIPFVNYHNYQDNYKIISSGYIGNNVLVDLFGPPRFPWKPVLRRSATAVPFPGVCPRISLSGTLYGQAFFPDRGSLHAAEQSP